MNITLTPELETFVREGVAAGRFTDAQTALIEGLSLLQEHEEELKSLRAKIQVGIDQIERGEYVKLESDELEEFFEDITRRGRERLASTKHT